MINVNWEVIFKVIQVTFFIAIGVCTAYNLRLTARQTKLIFKPVVGIVDVKTTRMIDKDKEDIYQNVKNIKINFIIQNTGNLPAKNFKIETTGKIGNTVLPHTVFEKDEGVILIQNAKAFNTSTIARDTIRRLVEKEERLIYMVRFSYSDWENYETYSYSSNYEILVIGKNPLNLTVQMLSGK